jgi:hypothetical protein
MGKIIQSKGSLLTDQIIELKILLIFFNFQK